MEPLHASCAGPGTTPVPGGDLPRSGGPEGVHGVRRETLPATQRGKLYNDRDGRHDSPELLDQRDGRAEGAAGGEHVVDDEHAPSRADGVLVQLQGRRPVLEGVVGGDPFPRQLARLADRDHAHAAGQRHRGGQEEAAGLHPDHDVEPGVPVPSGGLGDRSGPRIGGGRRGQALDHAPESRPVREDRGEVAEEDTGLRVVGHVDGERGDQLVERQLARAGCTGRGGQGHRRFLPGGRPLGPGRCGRAPGRGAAVAPEALSGRTEDGDSTTTSASTALGSSATATPPRAGRARRALATGPGAAARAPAERAAEARRARTRRRSACTSGSRSLRSATIGVASMIEEYVPAARPTKSTSARSLSVPTPSSPAPTKSSPATGSSAMIEVLIDRISVWLIARLAASLQVMRALRSSPFTFSSTLSKTTTVSYREKPRMVRKPITVDGVTPKPTSGQMPAVTTMSCSRAAIAAMAILGWKRTARNSTTATRNTTSAMRAWSVMSRPQSGLTTSGLTWLGSIPAAPAIAPTTAVSVSTSRAPVRSSRVLPPTTWAEETSAPASLAACWTASSCCDVPGSRKLLPPSKSMPKLKPRKAIDSRQTSRITAVMR